MAVSSFIDPNNRLLQEVRRLVSEGHLKYDQTNDRLLPGRTLSKGEWLDKQAAMKDPDQLVDTQQSTPAPPKHMNTRLLLTRKA